MTDHATGVASALKILEDIATEYLPVEVMDRAKAAFYVVSNDVGDLERELEQARQESMASEGETEKAEEQRDEARKALAEFLREHHDRHHRDRWDGPSIGFRFCLKPVCDEAVRFIAGAGLDLEP